MSRFALAVLRMDGHAEGEAALISAEIAAQCTVIGGIAAQLAPFLGRA